MKPYSLPLLLLFSLVTLGSGAAQTPIANTAAADKTHPKATAEDPSLRGAAGARSTLANAKPDSTTKQQRSIVIPGRRSNKAPDKDTTKRIVSVRRPNDPAFIYESALEAEQPLLTRKSRGNAPVDLISPNLHKVWIPRGNDSIPPSSITMEEDPTGFDLVFEFVNNTPSPKRLGEIVVGGVRFPETITTRVIYNDGKPTELSHNNQPYFGGGATYPGGLYSPVAVLQNGQDTIGMSMLYDVREYRHSVFIRIESPGGIYTYGGRNWQTRFVFDRDDEDEGGRIQPGEQRTYRVCVRVHRGDPSEWVRTLLPYRDFFHSTYGPVRYERDPRPVRGMELAQVAHLSPENPRGFLGGDDRPDIAGFIPVVDRLRHYQNFGFDRTMIWQPTGLYNQNRALNYPFNFTTGWESVPAMRDSQHMLKYYGQSSADLGLWWGTSSYVMPKEWDTGPRARFDTQNPEHVERAREELDGAMAVHATTIGLDSMSGMPGWEAYDWVLQLQTEYPDTKFVFETLCPDFIHTITPTFLYGTRIPETSHFAATSPMMLADFLNPGHETWALISGQDVKINAGLPPTDPVPFELFYQRCKKAAEDGYVPVVFGPMPTTSGLSAHESWLRTIPADLR